MQPFSLYSQAPIPGDYVEQDMKAQYILNQCRLGSLGIPSKTTGDRNCLFNATSITLSGNKCLSGELRMRTAVEMALNADKYGSRDDHDGLLDHSPSYEASLHDCCTEGSYSSIWTIMALSTVVGLPIHSIYPPMNGTKCLTHLALSKKFETEESRNRPPIIILWSRLGPWRPPTWTGNHFVPVLVREQVILPYKESRTTSPDVQATKVEKLSNSQTKVEKLSDSQTYGSYNETPVKNKQNVQFKPKEFSMPVNTFIIADTEGNEFKVTQVIKPGNEKHESVCAEKDESVCAEKDESVCVEKDESVCAEKDESVCVNSEERPQDTSEISCENIQVEVSGLMLDDSETDQVRHKPGCTAT